MSITWDLPVQGKLCQIFGGTCIYIYKKKNLPEIFQYIAKKNVEKSWSLQKAPSSMFSYIEHTKKRFINILFKKYEAEI